MRMRYGVHRSLEDQATALIDASFAGSPTGGRPPGRDKILTPAQIRLRRRREMLVSTGVPDPSIRQGLYRRAWNPVSSHLNARDGHAGMGGRSRTSSPEGGSDGALDSLTAFVEEHLA